MISGIFKQFTSLLMTLVLSVSFTLSDLPQPAIAGELPVKQQLQDSRIIDIPISSEDAVALSAISATTAAATSLGSITAATITTTTTAPLWGLQILGSIGLTTTSTAVTAVTLPAAGIVAVSGLAVWGGYKVYQALRHTENVQNET